MKRFALVSVYDKSGLEPFVRGLRELGYGILSTGGTAEHLLAQGMPVTRIEEYTGQAEMLEGRVKTLNPKIHAGILARRDNKNDLEQLAAQGIAPIDFVVVNLYPFTYKVKEIEEGRKGGHESLIEYIDVGGPTLLRAAAKNCRFVAPVCDAGDYGRVLGALHEMGELSYSFRQELALKVFRTMALYDGEIARYFSLKEGLLTSSGERVELAPLESLVLERSLPLRYGENSHQQAALYRRFEVEGAKKPQLWTQLQGKELSYNNLLDMHATLDLFLDLVGDSGTAPEAVSVIVKHTNPCGVAIRKRNLDAFTASRSCDPLSAFGGIVAVSGVLDGPLAESILQGFVEVVLAGSISADAEEIFARKKNVRLIKCNFKELLDVRHRRGVTVRNFDGDYLLQTTDTLAIPASKCTVVAGKPGSDMLLELDLAWKVCKHVKSNAIVLARDRKVIGVGAGQMSRFDAAKIAVDRARFHGHELKGAVAASDAFLPFPDTLQLLQEAGVSGLIQPGGSIKDEQVIKSAQDCAMTMLFTKERHFRH